MENTFYSINKYFRETIAPLVPDFNLFTEPDYQEVTYPCIVLHHSTELRKSKINRMNMMSVQVDVITTNFERQKALRVCQTILRNFTLTDDIPGTKRRIPKYQFYDDQNNILETPTQVVNSDVLYELGEDVQMIHEPDYPELMHYIFSIDFSYNDEGAA